MRLLEISKNYNELATPVVCPSFEDSSNYKKAKPNEICVEIVNGKRMDVIRLAETVGKGGFVYSVDISDGLFEKAVDSDKFPNIEFIKSSPEKIKLNDGIADLLISNCSIGHSFDRTSIWNEIYRILKKGGRFVIKDIYLSKAPASSDDNLRLEHDSQSPNTMITRDEYLNLLGKVGFSTIAIIEESTPYYKGDVMVANWTIAGQKPMKECDWCY